MFFSPCFPQKNLYTLGITCTALLFKDQQLLDFTADMEAESEAEVFLSTVQPFEVAERAEPSGNSKQINVEEVHQ